MVEALTVVVYVLAALVNPVAKLSLTLAMDLHTRILPSSHSG